MDPFKTLLNESSWSGKVSNPRQLGGIETSIIDQGQGKGNRIAWVNTGSGLRFKIAIDRAMDIVDAFYKQYSLSWLSRASLTPPNTSNAYNMDWLSTFNGGLLTTCGLTHVGGPEKDEHGERGLHDQINRIPASIQLIEQPDLDKNDFLMKLKGSILQSSVFGPHLELERTITSSLGDPVIRLHDVVTNRGNTVAPHMILYHMNFGWPLVDKNTEILWEGKWQSREDKESEEFFNDHIRQKRCSPPMDMHQGGNEAVAFIDVKSDKNGLSRCGIYNEKFGLKVLINFKKDQLPWVTNWQHWGKNEYVTALEPGSHPPVGQAQARRNESLINLEPGESRIYEIEIVIEHDE